MSGADDGVATSSVLFAVHKHLQLRCAQRSAAYLACKKNNQDSDPQSDPQPYHRAVGHQTPQHQVTNKVTHKVTHNHTTGRWGTKLHSTK